MQKNIQYLILLAVSIWLIGCGSYESVDPGVSDVPISGEAGSDPATTTGLGDESISEVQTDPLSIRVIYFAYDSSQLTAESENIVRAHAQYLTTTNLQVVLEGHADERGTREYNLALAEDRAKSVALAMQALGVTGSRIQTISYGEERPIALGHDDTAWQQNRRVEILYQ